jgi:hypothetical protein
MKQRRAALAHLATAQNSRFIDPPEVSQAEMMTAAVRLNIAANNRLGAMTRKDDPDAYDRALADVRATREAIKSIEIFGPGA